MPGEGAADCLALSCSRAEVGELEEPGKVVPLDELSGPAGEGKGAVMLGDGATICWGGLVRGAWAGLVCSIGRDVWLVDWGEDFPAIKNT